MFDALFTPDRVLAATAPEAWVDALVHFECELAAAQEQLGMLPPGSAELVARAAGRANLTPSRLGADGRASGNPVIALVRAVDAAGGEGPVPVHHGATSQDAMDSAAMLVARQACELVLEDLDAATDACAALARRYRDTPMTARTLLQPALPTTFGYKVAGWLVALDEAAATLRRVASHDLAVQLGGAAGTMAAFGGRGPALSAALAARLGLQDPALPWHTDRGRVLRLGAALAGVATACAKVALDVALLAQAEVGEVAEGGGPGRGGSSTMPQKANPVGAVSVLAAGRHAHGAFATLVSAGVQDHERAGTGGWHAEWQAMTALLRAAGGCTANVSQLLGDLTVHGSRMADNLAATHGVVVAERVTLDLGHDLGRERAREVVGRAAAAAQREGRPLRDVLDSLPEVADLRSPAQLDELCDPAGYLGATDQLVDRALLLHVGTRAGRTPPPAPGEAP